MVSGYLKITMISVQEDCKRYIQFYNFLNSSRIKFNNVYKEFKNKFYIITKIKSLNNEC